MDEISKAKKVILEILEMDVYDSDCRIHDIWNIFLLLGKHKLWVLMDILLELIDPRKISLDDLLSILLATSWYKTNLKNRSKFFKNARRRLDCRDPQTLEGLE